MPEWAVRGRNDYPGVVLVMTGGEPLLQDNITGWMQQQLVTLQSSTGRKQWHP